MPGNTGDPPDPTQSGGDALSRAAEAADIDIWDWNQAPDNVSLCAYLPH